MSHHILGSFKGLTRTLQMTRLPRPEFEKMKERFLEKWRNERREKCFLTSKNFKKGAELQAPFHVQVSCEDRKWKMKKEKKFITLRRWLPFFLSNILFSPRRRFSCLLYFAGTHNSMTCQESSDWRRVVTGLNFCGYFKLLQIHVKSFDLVRTLRRRSISDRSCLSQEFLRLKIFGVRPNNRNRVKVTSVFHNVWNILKQPGFEENCLWRISFISFACLKVDLDSA